MTIEFHHIVLVGFMGVGKTTVGRILAKKLGYGFIDIDQRVEEEEGAVISDIFLHKGEAYFRKAESRIIRRISREAERCVIATGGGALLNPENLKYLRAKGLLICLTASPAEIFKRVRKEGTRPLLAGENPLRQITRLLKQRKKIYQVVDRVIHTDQKSPQEVYEMIKSKITLSSPAKPAVIPVQLGSRSYSIFLGAGFTDRLGEEVARSFQGQVAVITNPLIWKFHGASLRRSLVKAGLKPRVIRIPDGERYKTLRWVNYVYGELLKCKFERNSPLLAFGGGVIGDLAGFVSGTFLRGTPFIQVPTTLIAQVDSSIGGKTGVNHPLGKNLIGLFHQPRWVWIETGFLDTLKKRDFVSGFAEIIKYGIIADEKLFDCMEKNRSEILAKDPEAVFHLIKRSCEIKAGVVSRDERESGVRKKLNYGHTMGHAIEAGTGYKTYRHGEAIGMGMHFAAMLARRLGYCSGDLVKRQKALIESFNLPANLPRLKPVDLLKSMALDKKVKEGKIYFILPKKLGEVVIRPVEPKAILKEIRSAFST